MMISLDGFPPVVAEHPRSNPGAFRPKTVFRGRRNRSEDVGEDVVFEDAPKCPRCNFRSRTVQEIADHQVLTGHTNLFVCSHCARVGGIDSAPSFPTQAGLSLHLADMHRHRHHRRN